MDKIINTDGFRMPAEWEKQNSTWLAWPHNKNDWPGLFAKIPSVFREIIFHISKYQKVNLLVQDEKQIIKIQKYLLQKNIKLGMVTIHVVPTNRVWTRDTGPIYLINKKKKKKILLNWGFNAWAKYKDYQYDNMVPLHISNIQNMQSITPMIKIKNKYMPFTLEGGSIDVNGEGTLITTKECLLGKVQQRNPGVSKKKIENTISKYLNIKKFIWLNKGIVGDDTHGHVDDISRFFSTNKIFTAIEHDKRDKNFLTLKENIKILEKSTNQDNKNNEIVEIPMPKPLFIKRTRVPASYLNFYFANNIVLVPIFNDNNDDIALNIIQKNIPNKKIIPINCKDLIWGFGAIHCMTQQEPSV